MCNNSKCSFDNFKPFSSSGLSLSATHFTSTYCCTYYILYPEQKTHTNYYTLFPLHYKRLRLWEFCSLNDPWSSLPLPHAFINQCTSKSSQFYIIISMDGVIHACVLIACISSKYSKCISAIKRILFTIAIYISSSSSMYLCISLYCDTYLKSSA